MKTFSLNLGVSILLLAVGLLSTTAQGISSFGFGYATRTPEGNWTLTVINPDGSDDTIPLPIPLGNRLIDVTASPDGQWLMLLSSADDVQSTIQIMNVHTGEIRLLNQGNVSHYAGGVFRRDLIPQWSPNSQYLAYNMIFPDGRAHNAHVYNVTTGTSVIAFYGTTLFYPYDLAWSPDSTQLAVVTARCREEAGGIICGSSIERFSIPSLQHLGGVYAGSERGEVCNLTWSPDGNYIAYIFSCDINISNFYYEIFLLNLQQSSVQQVTALTNPAPLLDTLPLNYNNYYTIEWSADNHLLAGITYGQGGAAVDPATFSAQTFVYPVPAINALPLLTEFTGDWGRNPVTGTLAYRAEAIQLDASNLRVVASRQTKIGTYQNNSVTEIASGTPGCDYRWSPDGALLMYRDVSQEGTLLGVICSLSDVLVLFRSSTGAFTQYEIADEALSAGWIALPEPPPPTYTATATNTTIPTETATPTPVLNTVMISPTAPNPLILSEETRAWYNYNISLSATLTGSECVTVELDYYPPTPTNYAHVQTKPNTMSTWSTALTLVFDANHTTYNVRIRARDDSTNHTGAVGRLSHRIIENSASGCTSAAGFPVNTVDSGGTRLTGSPFNGGNDASAAPDSRNVLVFTVTDND